MRLLACQIEISHTRSRRDQLRHIDNVIAKLDARVAAAPVDLVLLPELSTLEYSARNFQLIDSFSEDLRGETYHRFSAFCRRSGVAVCYGLPRRDGPDTYISQVVLDGNGDYVTHYDKIHTAEYGESAEGDYFRRGRHLAVFDIGGIRAALIICYDIRFAGMISRLCGELGAELILHPVAFGRDLSFHTWKDFVVTRAVENQVYFISVNRSGEHFGGSIFCPPWVDHTVGPAVFGTGEELRSIEISRETLKQVRRNIPYRRDRLQEYARLPVRRAGDTSLLPG